MKTAKILLRLSPELKKALEKAAIKNFRSLNQEVVWRLENSFKGGQNDGN